MECSRGEKDGKVCVCVGGQVEEENREVMCVKTKQQHHRCGVNLFALC